MWPAGRRRRRLARWPAPPILLLLLLLLLLVRLRLPPPPPRRRRRRRRPPRLRAVRSPWPMSSSSSSSSTYRRAPAVCFSIATSVSSCPPVDAAVLVVLRAVRHGRRARHRPRPAPEPRRRAMAAVGRDVGLARQRATWPPRVEDERILRSAAAPARHPVTVGACVRRAMRWAARRHPVTKRRGGPFGPRSFLAFAPSVRCEGNEFFNRRQLCAKRARWLTD